MIESLSPVCTRIVCASWEASATSCSFAVSWKYGMFCTDEHDAVNSAIHVAITASLMFITEWGFVNTPKFLQIYIIN